MAKIVGDTHEHRRRHVRRAADRLPDVGDAGLQRPAEGRDGVRGRLRRRRHHRRRRRPSRRPASTSSRSRRSTTRRPPWSAAATRSSRSRTRRPSQALVTYLATPEAASIWAAKGGFSSPNKKVDPSVYPDDITRATATALAEADTFRFDMSDLAPAAFGGTVGQGEWKDLQDFLKTPTDVDGAAAQLEADAAKAFGS